MGFRSHLTILPEQGGGLVILGNWSDLPNRPLREELMEVAFPEARCGRPAPDPGRGPLRLVS